jgi:hypothetical protein
VPVLELAFEELPGATQFADIVTGQTAAATCSGDSCPLVGVGVPPRTDRALYFDGVDDWAIFTSPVQNDFTYTFWFKSDPAQSYSGGVWWVAKPLLLGLAGTFEQLYGVSLGDGNKVFFGVDSQSISSQPVALGQWHQVVVSRRAAAGEIALYVDDQTPVTAGGVTVDLPANPQVLLGNLNENWYRGSLDYLTVHATAFGADAAASLYKGELKADLGYTANPSYCVVSAATTSGFAWSRITAKKVLKRGDGPVVNSASLTLQVDPTPPTSTLTSLAGMLTAGKYLKAPNPQGPGSDSETRVIGSNAYDTGSGVDHVDVLVNDQSFRATGRATWAAPLVVREGNYSVQSIAKSIATDGVGNQEVSGPVVNFIADGTPPNLNVNVPGQYVMPTRATNSKWVVALSRTAQDGGAFPSGMDANTLEAFMETADGSSGGW